ncbi:hypothetical protein V5S96_02830 [Corynebacterium mastitidis]|uniref:Maltokinase N-terminal cap domain-containing protein n=1 Tax=Corynebacterium mastitidis TaxID=161890 RepID=A0ABU8NX17_9CORY
MSENQNTAEVYMDAALSPGKDHFQRLVLLREGLIADGDEVAPQVSWRLLDPEGQVGVEIAVLRANARLVQVPLTYRPRPLEDGEGLLGEMEHSVLGTRYIYDARRDPAFPPLLAAAVREGVQPAGKRDPRTGETQPPQVRLEARPGAPEGAEFDLLLEPEGAEGDLRPGTLVGSWGEGERADRAVLARARGPR